MDTHSLRNFIYINPKIVNDYLSIINQNYNRIAGIEKVERDKYLGFDKVIQAKTGKTLSEENTLEYLSVDSANFNQLYHLLESEKILKYYETMDDEIWQTFRRKDVLDAFVNIRLPNVSDLAQGTSEIMPYLSLLSEYSDKIKIDNKTQAGLSLLGLINGNKKIDIIMPMEDDKKYKFFGKIQLEYLKGDRSQLMGEYNVVGKIIKIVQKKKPVKISFMEPFLDRFGKNKLTKDKMKGKKMPKKMEETIRFPAAELDILAIYR